MTPEDEGPDRPARDEDVDRICAELPGTWFGVSWGDRPTWLVEKRVRDGVREGSGFVVHRAPHHTALDPQTGEPYPDLLVIATPDASAKSALVDDEGPFFTVDHFARSNAVLVQRSRLGELSCAELREVLTEAWIARAPARLVRDWEKEHTDG